MLQAPDACCRSAPPRRRWLQFSLRTLLVLMVPAACVAAWVGYEYRAGLRQKEAIAWIEKLGGNIQYHDDTPHENWWRTLFGSWFPERVKAIDLTPLPPDLGRPFVLKPMPGPDDGMNIDLLSEFDDIRDLDLRARPKSDLGWLTSERLFYVA